MKSYHRLALAVCAGIVASVLGGCEQEGPAERTGEEIDEAVEETNKQLEEAEEKAREEMQKRN